MQKNLKSRVIELLDLISEDVDSPISVREFCMEHDINYKSLYNAFKADKMGIQLIDSFKNAVPDLNMNWFIYGEGNVLLSQSCPNENLNNYISAD